MLLIGIGSLIAIYSVENIHEFLEIKLAHHMVFEHGLFFLLGAFSVKIFENLLKISVKQSKKYKDVSIKEKNDRLNRFLVILSTKWSKILRSLFKFKNIGFIFIFVTIVFLVFWHIPTIFDTALLNEFLHQLQHFSFIVVGALGYLSTRLFNDSYKILLLVVLGSMISAMGVIFSLLNEQIFMVYTVNDHNFTGIYMVVTGLLILFIGLPLFVIQKTFSYIKSKTGKNSVA